MSGNIHFTEAIRKSRPTSGPGAPADVRVPSASTPTKKASAYCDPCPDPSSLSPKTPGKRRASLVEGKTAVYIKPTVYQDLEVANERGKGKLHPPKDKLESTLGSFSIASSAPTEERLGSSSGGQRGQISRGLGNSNNRQAQPLATSGDNQYLRSLSSTVRSVPPITPVHRASPETFPLGSTRAPAGPPRRPPTRYLASPGRQAPLVVRLSPAQLGRLTPSASSSNPSPQRQYDREARATGQQWWDGATASTTSEKAPKAAAAYGSTTSPVLTEVRHPRYVNGTAQAAAAGGNPAMARRASMKGHDERSSVAVASPGTSGTYERPPPRVGTTIVSAKKVNEALAKSPGANTKTVQRSPERPKASPSSLSEAQNQQQYQTITRRAMKMEASKRSTPSASPARADDREKNLKEKSTKEKRRAEQQQPPLKSAFRDPAEQPAPQLRTRRPTLRTEGKEPAKAAAAAAAPPLSGFAPVKTGEPTPKKGGERARRASGVGRKSFSGAPDRNGSFAHAQQPTVSPKERSRKSISGSTMEQTASVSHGHPFAIPPEELARSRGGSQLRPHGATEPSPSPAAQATPKRKSNAVGGAADTTHTTDPAQPHYRRTISEFLAVKKRGGGSAGQSAESSKLTSPDRGRLEASPPSGAGVKAAQVSSPLPVKPSAADTPASLDVSGPAVAVKLKMRPATAAPAAAATAGGPATKSTFTTTNTKSNQKTVGGTPPPAAKGKAPVKEEAEDEDNPLFTRTVYSAPATQVGDEAPSLCPAVRYDFNFHTSTWVESDTMVRVPHPNRGLAQGGMRACFEVYNVDETGLSTAMVAKMFRRNIMDVVERDYYNECEMQCVCGVLADAFTNHARHLSPMMKVGGGLGVGGGFLGFGGGTKEKEVVVPRPSLHYLDGCVVRIPFKYIPETYQTKRTGFFSYKTQDTRELLFMMEPKLNGGFTKYTSNDGQVYYSNETRVSIDEHNKRLAVVHTAEAFSHFTLVESGGSMLVCDLQGVGGYFTDPQIHTIDGECFGMGNMGMQGIRKWISKHKCNEVCRELKLKSTDGATLRTFENTEKRNMYYKKVQTQMKRATPSVKPEESATPTYKPYNEMTEKEKQEYVVHLSRMY